MKTEPLSALAIWKVTCRSKGGLILHEEIKENLIVDIGRQRGLEGLFTTLPSALYQQLGVGTSAVAAAASDIGLGSEITLGSTPAGSLSTRVGCTNVSLGSLTNADVVFDSSVSPYRYKIVMQGVYATTDDNGTTFNEFGLFDNSTFPAEVIATNMPSAGSNVTFNVASTTGFTNTDTIIIYGNTGSGFVVEEQVINNLVVNTSIRVATLSHTYTSTPTLTDINASGHMFNHFILTTPISKNSGFSVTANITIRF